MLRLGKASVLGVLFALVISVATAGGADKPAPPTLPEQPTKTDLDGDKLFEDLEAKLAALADSDPVRVMVLLKQAATASAVDALRGTLGGFSVRHRYSIVPGFAATLTKAQVEALARLAVVAQVEEDSVVTASNASAQSSFGVTKARVDAGVTGDGDGNPTTYSKDDFVAAVIDTGIDQGHKDLDSGKVIGWNDLVNGLPTPYDDNGHGTHVAGSIAGSGDARADLLYRGAAYGGALVGVKVLDGNGNGLMSDVTAGINWVVANKATYGVEAINLSLGTSGCSNGNDSTSLAVNNASAAGIVVVVAAGNSGPGTCTIGSPGAAANALTVGAMADTGTGATSDTGPNGFYQASFSSRGMTLDGRIKPDVSAPGVNIKSTEAGTAAGYVSFNGTSMATPFVAGVALLMLDANPALTPTQVKSTIMSTAVDWARGGDNKTQGTTGQDIDYGAGRLDGYRAIEDAKGIDIGTPPDAPVHEFREGTLGGTGQFIDYSLNVTSTQFPIGATLIHPSITAGSAATPDFDLRLFDPNNVQVATALTSLRQDQLGHKPTMTGTFRLRVESFSGSAGFILDLSGAFGSGGPDLTPPTVTSVSPADLATSVPWSTNVSVSFSEAMNQAATQGAFSLSDSSQNPVAGTFSWAGNTLTFDPLADLAPSTTYTGRVTTAAADLAGNMLQSDKVWTFTTTAADVTPPTVTSVSPVEGASSVPRTTNVNVVFSEAMNQAATQSAFSLRDPSSSSVAGAFSWSGNTLTFNPSSDLALSTTYTARVTTAAMDLAGNTLQSDKVWTFTTVGGTTAVTDNVDTAITDIGTPSGSASSLTANDNVFYVVKGTSTSPRETQWRGVFSGVPAGITNLRLTTRDKSSPVSTRTIEIFNATAGTWIVLDQRSLASAEVALILTPPGLASDYVDASGQMIVRLRTTRSGSLHRHRTDQLQALYDTP